MSADACPVLEHTQEVMQSARRLAGHMRRLRTAMRRCRACPQETGCLVLIRFNQQIQVALAEVVEEWDLHPSSNEA
jgi:hypothetical protein